MDQTKQNKTFAKYMDDYSSTLVEVPLDVLDLVHLVAQLGSELDPKCDT